MQIRSFTLVAFSVLSLAAIGCSAESSESASASSADVTTEATSNQLLDQTIVKGTLTVGAKSKVTYEPDQYKQTQINGVPYLAWELVAPVQGGLKTQANGIAKLAVDVEGNFPGTPDVLLVDDGFNIVGQARGTSTDLGDKASLAVDASAGAKFILVRDMDWVRPMDFEITLSQ